MGKFQKRKDPAAKVESQVIELEAQVSELESQVEELTQAREGELHLSQVEPSPPPEPINQIVRTMSADELIGLGRSLRAIPLGRHCGDCLTPLSYSDAYCPGCTPAAVRNQAFKPSIKS